MLKIITGENRLLPDALTRDVGRALSDGEDTLYIVVPKQLTLMTERLLLNGLSLRGSFRLRVLSPARLCSLIFDETGLPEGERIDDRGRVMLVRRAVKESEGLSIYRDAAQRRGFGVKCARQLQRMAQYGVTPDMLLKSADMSGGSTAMRLHDLSIIGSTMNRLSAGLYLDGETELRLAAAAAGEAPFVRGARFFLYGFDMIPPTLIDLFAQLTHHAASALYYCPARLDAQIGDVDQPVRAVGDRLAAAARAIGVEVRFEAAEDCRSARDAALVHLSKGIFTYPQTPLENISSAVTLYMAKDEREECLIAAATARRLAAGGMRYGDMQLVCADLSALRQTLIDAFALFEVPLFLNNSRAVSRMAVAEALLTALRLVAHNYRREDVEALMRTGMTALNRYERDCFANYCLEFNIEGSRFTRPLTRGREAQISFMEPLREKLIAPVAALSRRLKAAVTLKGQLKALYGYLEDIDAYRRCLGEQKALIDAGLKDAAGTLAQAWNSIMGAMDQMVALMGEEKLSLRELSDTLCESLDAAVVKPLPQSGDAVFAQSAGQLLMQPAAAVFLIGLNDRGAKDDGLLLSDAQNALIAQHTGVYPGPTAEESILMRRYYVRAAIGMATQRLYLSYALSNGGSAAGRGVEITEALRLLPRLKPVPEEEIRLLLSCAPAPAAATAARALSLRRDSKRLNAAEETILATLTDELLAQLPELERRMTALRTSPEADDDIDPELAVRLYRALETTSISALERYAGCPFTFFLQKGLNARLIEAPDLRPRDEGDILHFAVSEFMKRCADALETLSREDIERFMAEIIEIALTEAGNPYAREDHAVTRAEYDHLREVARVDALALAEHMSGSRFRVRSTEVSFGTADEDGNEDALMLDGTRLIGRIDRLDSCAEPGALRVIDYKRSGKKPDLSALYHGLRLQLPLYMAVALKKYGLRNAGFYYFPLDAAIVRSESTDPEVIRDERRKAMRMDGLLPVEEDLRDALSARLSEVFNVSINKDGSLSKRASAVEDADFKRLIKRAIDKAQEHVRGILGGKAAVAPVTHNNTDACTYCDSRAACLFDAGCDAQRRRKRKHLSMDEVLTKLASGEEA